MKKPFENSNGFWGKPSAPKNTQKLSQNANKKNIIQYNFNSNDRLARNLHAPIRRHPLSQSTSASFFNTSAQQSLSITTGKRKNVFPSSQEKKRQQKGNSNNSWSNNNNSWKKNTTQENTQHPTPPSAMHSRQEKEDEHQIAKIQIENFLAKRPSRNSKLIISSEADINWYMKNSDTTHLFSVFSYEKNPSLIKKLFFVETNSDKESTQPSIMQYLNRGTIQEKAEKLYNLIFRTKISTHNKLVALILIIQKDIKVIEFLRGYLKVNQPLCHQSIIKAVNNFSPSALGPSPTYAVAQIGSILKSPRERNICTLLRLLTINKDETTTPLETLIDTGKINNIKPKKFKSPEAENFFNIVLAPYHKQIKERNNNISLENSTIAEGQHSSDIFFMLPEITLDPYKGITSYQNKCSIANNYPTQAQLLSQQSGFYQYDDIAEESSSLTTNDNSNSEEHQNLDPSLGSGL